MSSPRMRIPNANTCMTLLLFLIMLIPLDTVARERERDDDRRGRLPGPVTDATYYENGAPSAAQVSLGKVLFFDKLLSGNGNMSCASCHHALTDTGDGLSLPVGEGGHGLGVTRDTGTGADAIHVRVPRNAPPVFNLGAKEFRSMFFDGRVEVDHSQPMGFRTPAGSDLPAGLANVLAAQAMFPVTSDAEMAGQPGENPIADAAAAGNLAGPGGVWEQIAERIRAIPEYVQMFRAAFPEVRSASDITYVHAANAIAAFEATAWRADNSPFDRFLRGERTAMNPQAVRGMQLFYGDAGCAACHSGPFQTDQRFHAIAMPQIGPGKGDGFDGHEDFGRERVTKVPADRYRFRTLPLRNVMLTGPWGHAGTYNSLEAVIRHHLDPAHAIRNYDRSQAVLPSRPDLDAVDFVVQDDPARVDQIIAANELSPSHLSDRQMADIMEFLRALTDPASIDLRKDVPPRVPSGFPLAE